MNDSSSLNTQPVATRGRRRTKQSWVIKDVFTTSKYKEDAFSVPKYKTVQAVADGSEGEEFDFTGVDLPVASSAKGKGKQKATTSEPDGRRAKRRKVTHDFDFLEASLPHTVQATTPSSPPESAFAVPSSDLLKYIHHFACNYYFDRGQLFNESRTYRRGLAAKKRAKLAAKEKLLAEDANSDDEERADPEAEVEAEAEAEPPPKTKSEHRRDMYKTMDGSALLAIGMLLQEHIGRILAPRIPEGWEEGVLDESEDEEDDPDEDGDEESEDKNSEDSDSDERSDGVEDDREDDKDEDGQDSEGRGSVNVQQSDEDETD